jgi:type I restriction enzyme S subunit
MRLNQLKAPNRYSMVGGPFGSKLVGRDYVADGVPVIRGTNLPQGARFSLDDLVFVSEEKVSADLFGNLAFPGDIVVTQRGTLGQVGMIPATCPYVKLVVSQSQMKLTVDDDKADALYVYYALRSPHGQHEIHSRAISAGVPHINLSLFKQILVPVPSLATQRKIAAILAAYDDLIENNEGRIKILEETARRIYREWFVDFRYPGHESVPLRSSEFGPIPNGWRVQRLSELVATQYGYTESASLEPVGPQFLRGMDMNKSSFIDWSTVPYCPITNADRLKYALHIGDVLVVRMADPGRAGIIERPVDAVFASYLIRLRPVDERLRSYSLFYFLSSDRYQNFVSGASTGTTRKSLSAPGITSIDLAVPPIGLQEKFEQQVGPLRLLLSNFLESNSRLRTARDLLLPRLVSGEIDVKSLSIELPEMVA